MCPSIENSYAKKNVVVLGSTGMLGSMIVEILSNCNDIQLLATTRKSISNTKNSKDINWVQIDFESASNLQISKVLMGADYVINCVGLIKQKAKSLTLNEYHRLNTLLPLLINDLSKELKFRYVQIGTDCVFSGQGSRNLEKSIPDATDNYGISKYLSESYLDNSLILRCSIIGKEVNGSSSLLSWFMSQEKNLQLNGYVNHYWNGISTLQFANILRGIIQQEKFFIGLHHLIPANSITKYELLHLFRLEFKRFDLRIDKAFHPITINRILECSNDQRNLALWNAGGYREIPTIQELVRELAIYGYDSIN